MSASAPEPSLETVDTGQAGASALKTYQRLHDAREQRARDTLGPVGGLLAKVVEEPANTRVWKQGGDGEVKTAARLTKLLVGTDVRLLHDRRVPGHGRANMDHIAVGPAGVTVIDSKTLRGTIRQERYGSLFSDRRTVLLINGRDRTALITGVEKQIGYVRSALAAMDPRTPCELGGALCFPEVDGLPWFGHIQVRAIRVDGPRAIARAIAQPGSLAVEEIDQIWNHLGRAFPPA